MKKILPLLFLFLSSFCLTSCIYMNSSSEDNSNEILQIGYDFVTAPTKVTEDFELPSYYHFELGTIEFYYIPDNKNLIIIKRTPIEQITSNEDALTMACITRSDQDVDTIIYCYIKFTDKVALKCFHVTIIGLENNDSISSSQNSKYLNHF